MPGKLAWPRNALRGRAFEELVELANAQYRSRGIAVVHKVPTEWMPLRGRDGRIVSAKVERKAAVDFLGVWHGRALAFDAKETSSERWPLARLEPHQAEFLHDFAAAGGIAFVLVSFALAGEAYVLPWEEWFGRAETARAGRRGAASLSLAEARASLRRAESSTRCVLDYLPALEA